VKKFAVAVVSVALLGAVVIAGPASARNAPGTTYYYGKGDAKKSDVTFAVSEGKVRKTLMNTGKVKCNPMGGTKIFKSFGGAKIKGHAFKRKFVSASIGAKFVFAGKIYGASANGRMLARIIDGDGNVCNSGKVRWDAHRVSKKEWKKHRHGYSVQPPSSPSRR
jgi:hypothetical protein